MYFCTQNKQLKNTINKQTKPIKQRALTGTQSTLKNLLYETHTHRTHWNSSKKP